MPNPTSKLNLVINGVTTQLDIHDANAVDLTNNQTVAGNKEFTGTTTAHDLVPSATDTYNFGSPSYQWNNAYIKSLTINGVACGDILTHNVSEFVDVSTAQTIGGFKTFSDGFSVNKPSPRLQIKSTTYSSETSSAMTIGDIAILNKNGAFSAWMVNQLKDDLTTRLCFRVFPRDASTYKGFVFDETCTLYPENSNNALGTSTNKWKSFNGVEPSGLSLPSDTSINIDTTDFTWGRNFTFTPSVNGHLFINIGSTNNNSIRSLSLKTGRGEYYFTNQTGIVRFTMPVYKGKIVTILVNSTVAETVIPSLSLFPCQGNV